jgi:transcriptional regulator with XRE-family HTH domain
MEVVVTKTIHTTDGAARLWVWLDRVKKNQREAAEMLGVHYTYLNQILSGDRIPGLANAHRIERLTGIPTEAWLSTEDANYAQRPLAHRAKRRIGRK